MSRQVARVVGATGTEQPPYRVELRAGAHQLLADEPSYGGGGDTGPSPFGYLLTGLAACTVMTLRMYADRKNWPLETVGIDARYILDDEGGASITRTITLPAGLLPEQRDRLAGIAERTPVTLAVRAGTPIETTLIAE